MDAINPLKTATAETYEFQTANPYLNNEEETTATTDSVEKEDTSKESTKQQLEKDFDYMAEGLRLMKEGNLSEAIFAFEACEAWRYLGQCQADNENEKPAIAAYLKCYELDPYDLDALLALGVSYTNEIDFFQALKFLREWIASHPEYSILAQDALQKTDNDDYYGGWGGSTAEHKKVVELFHKALEINANDPDLHTVLGVLYNITNEYDFAERHFKRALQARPSDPSLWNKLGATQANGQKCQIAIHAYSKALELKPNYVRALSNLGISFANQKKHTEACQSYLASLKLNPHAMPIWDHLRTSLMHLGRNDLMELIEKRDSLEQPCDKSCIFFPFHAFFSSLFPSQKELKFPFLSATVILIFVCFVFFGTVFLSLLTEGNGNTSSYPTIITEPLLKDWKQKFPITVLSFHTKFQKKNTFFP
ncbi:hypothetical protein RFI_11184 [Reticulomyxa filosa]|uniref:Uncharacterized protein n=1 Tax=Reticulomyxa filosa TaxID=46433 RepID=X6NJQ8_RETFI|nr:hypothetical protein RFI_11184 [Reticulomyxa filosa]|eukprot:ETO25949.1 hypothetical protein RFI_11184 [Reticulomyxa filosa]